MNFDYSYRAFLITSLIFGIVALLFISVELKTKMVQPIEDYEIEYAAITPEEIEEENQELATAKPISTHNPYNEAEKFIKQLERERIAEDKSKAVDKTKDMLGETTNDVGLNGLEQNTDKKELETKSKAPISKETVEKSSKKANDKNSSNSYRLVNRDVLYFPNPIYLCEDGGKIVINIAVNDRGSVTSATYSSKLSTSSNECLIDAAIAYALETSFNTNSEKLNQLGTITYQFPKR